MRNPLTIAFGRVLKQLRNDLNIPVEEFADGIGVNKNYLRLLESGGQQPHINKVVDLVRTLNYHGANFSYFGAQQVLMGIHMTQPLTRIPESNRDRFYLEKETIFFNLEAYDRKLYQLVKVFNRHELFEFPLKDFSNVTEIIEQEKINHTFLDFLSNYETYGESQVDTQIDWIVKRLQKVPTLHAEHLISIINAYYLSPMIMGTRTYADWEVRNEEYFTDLICFTTNSGALTSLDNLRDHKYLYLWRKKFKQAKMIVVDDDEKHGSQYQKATFKKNFSKVIANNKQRLNSFDKALEKIDYAVIKSDYNSGLVEELITGEPDKTNIEHKTSERFNAFWVYTKKKDNDRINIGFLGDINYSEEKQTYVLRNVVSLSFEYLAEKLPKLQNLWDELKNREPS